MEHEHIICVDLDHTLIRIDLMVYCFKRLILRRPYFILHALYWLLRGRAYLKNQLTKHIDVDVKSLPYREEMIQWLKEEKQKGAFLVLVTGSTQPYAEDVARHLNIFDAVHGSSETVNLIGVNKAALLNKLYGYKNYVYCGDNPIDLHVWIHSKSAVLTGVSSRLKKAVQKKSIPILKEFD